jgi:flagellar FliL protein
MAGKTQEATRKPDEARKAPPADEPAAKKGKAKKVKEAKLNKKGEPKKGKMKIVLPLIVVLIGAGGYYHFVYAKKKPVTATGAAAVTALPKGPILTLTPTTINLSDGHFLEVGLALQLASAKDMTVVTNDQALALNDAIETLSAKTMAMLDTTAGRKAAQVTLTKELAKTFDNKITAVYFTDFVMQ